MAQMERAMEMTAVTVRKLRMVVATVNLNGQREAMILMEQVSKDHQATLAEAWPRERVVMAEMQLMDLVMAIALISPVALVVQISGRTEPG